MAELRLSAPEPFDFKKPDEWAKWKRRFEQFRQASKLSNESSSRQVNTLLYCLGEEADDVLTSTNPTEEERKDYTAIMAKLDGYFQVRKNIIYERARFNSRNQLEGESAKQYITAHWKLRIWTPQRRVTERPHGGRYQCYSAIAETTGRCGIDSGKSKNGHSSEGSHNRAANRTGRQEESYLGGSSQQQTTSTVSDLY